MDVPVEDARTEVRLPSAGPHSHWVASWKASGACGRFQVLTGGAPLQPDHHAILGREPGVEPTGSPATGGIVADLILHGRCDWIDANLLKPGALRGKPGA